MINTNDSKLVIPYHPGNNLPIMFTLESKEQDYNNVTSDLVHLNSKNIFSSIADETNQNLSQVQKELLIHHWKLNHIGFQWLQSLMCTPTTVLKDPNDTLPKPMIIQTKNPSAKSCFLPLCAKCQVAQMTKQSLVVRPPKTQLETTVQKLKEGDLNPGDGVSLDHYQSNVQGWLPNSYGGEQEHNKYSGGTIGVDHTSAKIWLHHQVSLQAGKTLVGIRNLEQEFASVGIKIKQYNSNNRVF